MRQFVPDILQSLSIFANSTASNFLRNSTKNSVFSPYSLFLALFLTSVIDPNARSDILKTLQISNNEISISDQIHQLLFLTRKFETLPSTPMTNISTLFKNFISKYNLDDDHFHLSYYQFNKILRKIGKSRNKTDLCEEKNFLQALQDIDSLDKETILYRGAKLFKSSIEGEIYKHPIIAVSNSLFINSKTSFTLPVEVSKRLKKRIFYSQFPNPAHQEINEKIKNDTRGLIDNFISASDLPSSLPYFVANTLYFKAQWHHPFDSSPSLIPFTSISGKEKNIKGMQKDADYHYYESEDIIYVSLPFCKSSYTFELIMPKDTKQFNAIGTKLYDVNASLVNILRSKAKKTHLFLKMPKFTIQTELMNFNDVFHIQAVNSVLQKVVLIVDEKELAAVAATGVVSRGAVINEGREILINKSFHFIIRNQRNHVPLYIGTFIESVDNE